MPYRYDFMNTVNPVYRIFTDTFQPANKQELYNDKKRGRDAPFFGIIFTRFRQGSVISAVTGQNIYHPAEVIIR